MANSQLSKIAPLTIPEIGILVFLLFIGGYAIVYASTKESIYQTQHQRAQDVVAQELTDLQEELAEANAKNEKLERELAKTKEALKAEKEEHDDTRRKLAKAVSQLSDGTGLSDEEREKFVSEIEDLKANVNSLTIENLRLRNQNTGLSNENKRLNDMIILISGENVQPPNQIERDINVPGTQ